MQFVFRFKHLMLKRTNSEIGSHQQTVANYKVDIFPDLWITDGECSSKIYFLVLEFFQFRLNSKL